MQEAAVSWPNTPAKTSFVSIRAHGTTELLGPNLVTGYAAGNGPKEQFWGSRLSGSGGLGPALAIFGRGPLGNWSATPPLPDYGRVARHPGLRTKLMPRPTTNRNRPCPTLRSRVIFTSAQGAASGQIYAPGFFPLRSDNVPTIFMVIGGCYSPLQ